MRRTAPILVALAVLVAGCGGDEKSPTQAEPTPAAEPPAEQQDKRGNKDRGKERAATGTEIIVAGSEFGDMLYGADKQAIYIFENDRDGESVCYDECAEAWPPVYTEGRPKAGKGVDADLLGTTKRRDGKLQVTYAGQPLYFYVNEGPGEVRCHNVHLNGGLWWVVGPDGQRRP